MITENKSSWLRPSALDKLALCSQYRSDAVAGPAAARGTRIDEAFRMILAGGYIDLAAWPEEDIEALDWATATARALAGGNPLESREEHLRAGALGLSGTADLLCSDAGWSADLKTGQKRSYVAQQALYALGFMDDHFVDEWTVYLIYCDQQEVETLRYTREEGEKIVRDVLAKVADEGPATPNDYCGWCAWRYDCKARREALGILPFDGPQTPSLEEFDSVSLRDFVLRAAVVEDFAEKAREILKTRCVGGEKIPGVSLTSKRGARKLDAAELAPVPVTSLIKLLGSVSEAKAKEVWPEGIPFPEDKVQEMPGSSFVRVSRPKAGKGEK